MNMIIQIILLLVGFVVLVKGADFFVDGSSSIAAALKVPAVIIGLTVVAFGTSAPELAVSVTASLHGSNGIAVGNVVGSNMFNLLMVIGVSALIAPVVVNKTILKVDYPICIAATALLAGLTFFCDKNLTRVGGIVLLVGFALFLFSTIQRGLAERNQPSDAPAPEKFGVKTLLFTLIGIAGVILGGQLVVDSASEIAGKLGMSETLVGLTIVAIGTSLPELVTSVVAARKGQCDLAMGNAVGSNIFNILLILGAASAIKPIEVSTKSMIDMAILLGITALVFVFAVTRKKVGRGEALVMILAYCGYTAYIIGRDFA